jgi:hypothetical protein
MDLLEYLKVIHGFKNFKVTPLSVVVALAYILSKVNMTKILAFFVSLSKRDKDELGVKKVYIRILKLLINQGVLYNSKVNISLYRQTDIKLNKSTLNYVETSDVFTTFNGFDYLKAISLVRHEITSILFMQEGIMRISTYDEENIRFPEYHDLLKNRNLSKGLVVYNFVNSYEKSEYILVIFLEKNVRFSDNVIDSIRLILKEYLD